MREYFKGIDRKGDHDSGHDRGHNVETQDYPQKERTTITVGIIIIGAARAIRAIVITIAKAHAAHRSVGDRVLALGRHDQREALDDRKAKGPPELDQVVDGVVDGLVLLIALVVYFHVVMIDIIDKEQRHVDAHIDEAEDGENEIRVGRGLHVL